jgi:Fe-S cluster assembly protein SufD
MLLFPRIHLFAGASSEATLLSSTHTLSGENYCCSHTLELTLEENAHISHIQAMSDAPRSAWHFSALRALLKRNSSLKTVSVIQGGATAREDYRIALVGLHAKASLNGVSMLTGKHEAHIQVKLDHQAPSCQSTQLFKNVLKDTARASFEGKILVRQEAQKTEAFQLNQNLLLSPHALANSKPNLEIFADDVKASHGATVGQLDEEQLFYMQARGVSEQVAKNMLVLSFCREVLDLVSISSVRQQTLKHANHYFS